MEARNLAETKAAPIQLSIRIRHPSIDPREISDALDLEPEHFFKAGEARTPRAKGQSAGRHTQSYWLAPVTAKTWSELIEPSFMAAIAARHPVWKSAIPEEEWRKAIQGLRDENVEAVLLYFLMRLNSHQAFLQRIQADGGDVSLILLIERESAADFTLPPTVSGQLAQLGVSIDFRLV
jgi:hypothetical protein